MGKLKIQTALLLAAALTACGDDSDVFYTTSYPIARIEVSVSLSEPEKPDPENPDPENPDPENPDPDEPIDLSVNNEITIILNNAWGVIHNMGIEEN